MDIILIPGLWLDASSWDDITPALRDAGVNPRPLTMPGTGASGSDSAAVGIDTWVDAVVAEIDASEEPVVLVGHSGGGNVAWGAADRRPDRVSRVVFVDTVPPPDGAQISEFPLSGGVVPFPGWDFFDDEDVADLDEATRLRTAPLTHSVPGKVPTDPIALGDDSRHRVPVTLLNGRMDEATFRAEISQWGPFAAEFEAIADAEVVRLGTGHWPQFSAPERLAQALVAAIRR
ncbi:alpha/beta fold hydrolase [Microbacterium invictum]|uniref:Pimeloyl-ACP methyl ester carboxylesterase n=1 Tax=Microbacterium invictum TaxID=515415 RepID=A0AA40SN73_9MICO|nr:MULTISPECIES: alpha/beta hydrolase [Microbacterium]MBB4139283.1 pimeloyl-ACP methyl ester carboxylesterase [Microbacterium invictum]